MPDDDSRAEPSPQQLGAFERALLKGPAFLQRHLNTLLLAVTLLALAYFAWGWRQRADLQRRADALATVAGARDGAFNVQRLVALPAVPAADVLSAADAAVDAASTGLDLADDPGPKAQALLARGRVRWALASAPPGRLDPPATTATQPATTQSLLAPTTAPARKPLARGDYLAAAEADFSAVLRDHADVPTAPVEALFALAAIHETRGELDRAAERYTQLANEPAALEPHKQLALSRRASLDELRGPAFALPPASQPVNP